MSRPYIPVLLRQAVIERAKNHCEYCRSPAAYSPEIFEIEHVRPLSQGGQTNFANLALSCPACNRYKGPLTTAQDVETEEMVFLFNPRRDVWSEHFQWSSSLTEILPQTPRGRVTIITLKMNRLAVQRFRQGLKALNLHPAQTQTD